jgi:ribosome biogenesis protein ENP2
MANSTSVNGVKVYNLSEGKTAPAFASERAKRALAKDVDYRRRIDLLQDFHFPTLSRSVRVSPDGRYVCAAGGYPPQVKVFDVKELSLKFERHVDAEIVKMLVLADDFSKLCFLGADRSVSFHAKYGTHYSARIPTFGRDLYLDDETADLHIASAGTEVFRLNLGEGRFRASWASSQDAAGRVGHNAIASSPCHRLVTAAGEDGVVRVWDPRSRSEVGQTELPDAPAATCLGYEPSGTGLRFVVGTETGKCLLYDLRSSRPLLQKEHPYGLAVHTAQFRQSRTGEELVISADAKQIKAWSPLTGQGNVNIETSAPTCDLCVVPQARGDAGESSGLLFASGDQERIQTYYVPALGPAPSWASFLDSLTEELEEKESEQVYYDFKFVTRAQLEEMRLTNLIGTKSLRPWMHGFFIDAKLFEQVRAVTMPSAFDEWRKQRQREKLEQKRAQKIALREERAPKVNRNLAGTGLEKDERFGALFQNPDFQVDEESEEFRQMFPSGRRQLRKQDVDQAALQNTGEGAHPESDLSDDDLDERQPAVRAPPFASNAGSASSAVPEWQDLADTAAGEGQKKRPLRVARAAAVSRLLVDATAREGEQDAGAKQREVPMLKRLQQVQDEDEVIVGADGSLAVTFQPKPRSKSKSAAQPNPRARRGGKQR